MTRSIGLPKSHKTDLRRREAIATRLPLSANYCRLHGDFMSKPTTDAGEWMRKNGHAWGKPKRAPSGSKAKEAVGPQVRERRAQAVGASSRRVPPA